MYNCQKQSPLHNFDKICENVKNSYFLHTFCSLAVATLIQVAVPSLESLYGNSDVDKLNILFKITLVTGHELVPPLTITDLDLQSRS